MLPSWLAGLQEFSELEHTDKAISRYNGQSNFLAGKATHVSHTPRGSQWELQPTYHSVPLSNDSEYESDIKLLESSPLRLVL